MNNWQLITWQQNCVTNIASFAQVSLTLLSTNWFFFFQKIIIMPYYCSWRSYGKDFFMFTVFTFVLLLLFWLLLFVWYMRDFTCWTVLDTDCSRKAHLWTNKTVLYVQKDSIKKNIKSRWFFFCQEFLIRAPFCLPLKEESKFSLRGKLLAQRSCRISLDFYQA